MRSLVPVALLGCAPATDLEPPPVDLSDTFGTVEGELVLPGGSIRFASGVAYGASLLHSRRNVLVLTTWADSQCGADPWTGLGTGHRLDVAFDDDGDRYADDSFLWRCDREGYELCSPAAWPDVGLDVDLEDADELLPGDHLTGEVQLEGAVEGTLAFDVVWCGDDG